MNGDLLLKTLRKVNTQNKSQENLPRIHGEKDSGMFHYFKDDKIYLGDWDKQTLEEGLKANPGEEFKGKRKGKYYRFSQEEINEMVKGKILHDGGTTLFDHQAHGLTQIGI